MSSFQAHFAISETVPPGEYSVSLSNGQSRFVGLDSFVHPLQPHVSTLVVKPKPAVPTVILLDPEEYPHGINATDGTVIDSTPALRWAVAQAAAAPGPGPKVIQLGPGWYGLQGTILLPEGTTLAGAGMNKTNLMFQYQNLTDMAPALLTNVPGTRSWGIRDLQITANTIFSTVINVSASTDGFKLRRVAIRANSFFCASSTGVQVNATHPLRAHQVPWTEDTLFYPNGQRVPPYAIMVNGRNWEVSDCEIYSSWGVIGQSFAPPVVDLLARGGYGLVARNQLHNGRGATFGADSAKEWLIEDNTIAGTSVMSGGNSLATGTGAFNHHIFWGKNSFQFDWSQDREIMTFDGGGIGYAGPIASVSADGTTIVSSRLCRPTHVFTGGSMTVLNGTGAGQMRRLIAWGTANASCWFKIAAPFDAPVDPSSGQWLSAQIFKGAQLFEGNSYTDVGSFQFYGMAMDVVVHAEQGSRMTGFHTWGQWHRRNDTGDRFWHNQPHPNLRTQFLGLKLTDGNGSPHAGVPMVPANAFKEPVQFQNAAFSVSGAQRGEDNKIFPIPMNRFVVWRENTIEGWNVGVNLGLSEYISELVFESNRMAGIMTRPGVSHGSGTGPITYDGSIAGLATTRWMGSRCSLCKKKLCGVE